MLSVDKSCAMKRASDGLHVNKRLQTRHGNNAIIAELLEQSFSFFASSKRRQI